MCGLGPLVPPEPSLGLAEAISQLAAQRLARREFHRGPGSPSHPSSGESPLPAVRTLIRILCGAMNVAFLGRVECLIPPWKHDSGPQKRLWPKERSAMLQKGYNLLQEVGILSP